MLLTISARVLFPTPPFWEEKPRKRGRFSAYKAEDLPIRPNPFQLVVRQVRKDKEYVSDPAALKQLKVIRSCFDKADRIIVATDAGREGELIFRYIYSYLNCHKPFDRLWINSLTDKAWKSHTNLTHPVKVF